MKKVTLAIALAVLIVFVGCKKDQETAGTTLKASIEQQKGTAVQRHLHQMQTGHGASVEQQQTEHTSIQ